MSQGFELVSSLDDSVTDLCWNADDSVYVGLASGSIYHLSSEGTVLRHWVAHKGAVVRLLVHPDGDRFASAGEDGRVLLWNKQSQDAVELANEPVWIEQLECSASGQVLAASAGKTIFLWRGEESIGVWYDARRHVQAMSWAPDADKLATATNKGLYLWNLGNEEPMELLAFPGAAVSVAWKPDGKALAVGTQDGFLQVWRQGGQQASRQLTMSGYPGKVNCLSWHPGRDQVATAGGSDVVIWDMTEKGKKKALPLSYHQATVTVVSYSADGNYLLSGDRSGQVSLWDESGKQINALEMSAEITRMAWNSQGDTGLLGDMNGQLYRLEL